jgi:Cof subfamily protein (haloacid dehalogenase superfamily)
MSIKLIVTDLDGCLLKRDSSLPACFKEAFELMEREGVVFAAGSGRSIDGAAAPFGEYASRMAFVTDNGARVFHKGKVIEETLITYEDYASLLDEIERHDDVFPVACGVTGAWVQEGIEVSDEIARELIKYYPTWKACDFRNVPEPVIKFALLHFDDIEKNIYPYFKPYDGDKLRVQVTAYVWIDVYRSGLSKGVGVKALQEALGVTPEETMVFGDYLNDIPMAEHAGVSYAVENAHPKLKECFTETIGSNDDESVAKKIIELLR